MSSTEVLSTLQHISSRKLAKLADHRDKFEAQKKSILEAVAQDIEPYNKIRALLDGFEKFSLESRSADGLSLKNIRRFLAQSRRDPSVSPSLLKEWQTNLQHELDIQTTKYEYADLFGRLVTDWIRNADDTAGQLQTSAGDDDKPGSPSLESVTSFEPVGREEMHEQRKEWEVKSPYTEASMQKATTNAPCQKYAFTSLETDQVAIEKYLKDLFGSTLKAKKITKTPLQNLRETIGQGIEDIEPKRFNENVLKWCIKGLLRQDLFTGKKREALVDLQERTTLLKEMADVLNMDLESMNSWSWNPAPVPVSMRRQVNGKYRVFMDEEINQAILLHFIGTKWAVYMKQAFCSFFHSGAWLQSPFRLMSKKDKQRREYFLGDAATTSSSVRNYRRNMYQQDFFMTQLPSTVEEDSRDYSDLDYDNEDEDKSKSPLQIKQALLHLVTTELLLNTKLYGQFTVVQSDFKWFGPSLPHSTLFTVLKFLGVSDKWLSFFKKFVRVPVVFAQDGPEAQPQTRRRGVPMAHVLSDALGEGVMFCLDFAVNQKAGSNLYRFHDDLWFWGQEEVCVNAWEAIKQFSTNMGLELNDEKTGTVQVAEDSKNARQLSESLPKGSVRWGFLQLDSDSGRWIIEKEQVAGHVDELRRQLSACSSVFGWVQAWNSYVDKFFGINFGQAANCMGRQHVEMVIETFEQIQRQLFAGHSTDNTSDNVTEYLRRIISQRFGVVDVPDGFFYFPVEVGGLQLRNPFVPLFGIHKRSFRSSVERIERAFEEEEEAYRKAKERFDSGEYTPRYSASYELVDIKDQKNFLDFDEYTRFREETSTPLQQAYENLMQIPPEEDPDSTPRIQRALTVLGQGQIDWGTSGFNSQWYTMKPYWRWIVELHGGSMLDKFGGLSMGEKALLPIGLVSMLWGEKVRWQE